MLQTFKRSHRTSFNVSHTTHTCAAFNGTCLTYAKARCLPTRIVIVAYPPESRDKGFPAMVHSGEVLGSGRTHIALVDQVGRGPRNGKQVTHPCHRLSGDDVRFQASAFERQEIQMQTLETTLTTSLLRTYEYFHDLPEELVSHLRGIP